MPRMRLTLALEVDTGPRIFDRTIEAWMEAEPMALDIVDQQLATIAKAMSMAVRDKDSWRAPEPDANGDTTAPADTPSAPAPPDSNMAKTHRLTEARGGPLDGHRIWIESVRLAEGKVGLQSDPSSAALLIYVVTKERTADGWADIIVFEPQGDAP